MKDPDNRQIYKLLNDTFKDIALCFGGIFLTQDVDEKLVWVISNAVEELYYKSIARLEILTGIKVVFDSHIKEKESQPHPAIKGLLEAILLKPEKIEAKKND
ncbi:hypothetical protein ACFL2G_04765 [Candidatus Omnitrophota bacterium]